MRFLERGGGRCDKSGSGHIARNCQDGRTLQTGVTRPAASGRALKGQFPTSLEKSYNILCNGPGVDSGHGVCGLNDFMNQRRYLTIVGIVVAAGALLLASSCSFNSAPVISSLEAEAPGWVAPLGSLQVTCNASDYNHDQLSYNWSAEGGSILGTGSEVTWTAPEEVGMYDITVVVDDGKGAEATGSIGLIASNGPPPVIESLNVTADHKYLKRTATGYKVGKEQVYHIDCIASSNTSDELTYEWSCTDGEISGVGSNITWTAPDLVVNVTVTAKVFDSLGNWVRDSVLLEVVACSPCTFG